jgi:hypothetical protein
MGFLILFDTALLVYVPTSGVTRLLSTDFNCFGLLYRFGSNGFLEPQSSLIHVYRLWGQ